MAMILETLLVGALSGFSRAVGAGLARIIGTKTRHIFTTSRSPWINGLFKVYRDKSSEELIKFYRKQPCIEVDMGSELWEFAASMAIKPSKDGQISEQNVQFFATDSLFELDKTLDELTGAFEKRIFASKSRLKLFDGLPWRIVDIQSDGDNHTIQSERCRYFDSLRTSFVLDQPVERIGKSLREYLTRDFRLSEFSESRLPNHMGVVLIVETADGQILAQKRSKSVSIRPNTLSSSTSGTIELNDIVSTCETQSLKSVINGMAREAHEEIGISLQHDCHDVYFLGLIREFARGGFPDFYFFAKSKMSLKEISEMAERANSPELTSLIGLDFRSSELSSRSDPNCHLFQSRVSELLKSLEGKANLTLSLGIALSAKRILATLDS